jgi:hypothetical protein
MFLLSAACFLVQKSRFNIRVIKEGLLLDEVALSQAPLQALLFSPPKYHSANTWLFVYHQEVEWKAHVRYMYQRLSLI